jgi:hypothetical protein
MSTTIILGQLISTIEHSSNEFSLFNLSTDQIKRQKLKVCYSTALRTVIGCICNLLTSKLD